jgi:hypothetical protein
MAELELETVERAVRWCGEAGRQTTAGEVRAALSTLSWDQLLQVRALLADPPPSRPLGPHALADLARGVPADLAAEREREGRYPRPGAAPPPSTTTPAPSGAAPPPAATSRRASKAARRQVVVRKASSTPIAVAPGAPRLPLFEELLLPVGRAALSRIIRQHGGRRPMLVAAIGASHRRADGQPIGDADLDGALEHHGLDRAFLRRERDELFHAVRASAGVLGKAAAALGHDLASLGAAIGRLGLDAEVKRLREGRRRDLRAKATLSERALLWVGQGDALTDLGLLEEVEEDLRRRIPEHLRALATTGEPLELGLVRTLALPAATVKQLLTRLGIDLRAPLAPASVVARPTTPARAPAPAATRRPPRPAPARPAPSRNAPPRNAPARTSPARTAPPRAAPARGGERTPARRPSGTRPPGGRPGAPRPGGSRPPGGSRSPGGGSRPPGGSRSPGGGSRPPGGSRSPGGRPTSPRPAGPRPSGAPRRPTAGRKGPRR